MLKISKFAQRIIHAVIGDEVVILTICLGQEIISRFTIKSPEPSHLKEVLKILELHKDAPIYLYLDHSDQDYESKSLPGVDIFSISALARKKFSKEFNETQIGFYYSIGREDTARRDWKYIIATSKITPHVQKWLDFFMQFQNVIHGIHLVPYEMRMLIEKLKKIEELPTNTAQGSSFLSHIIDFLPKSNKTGSLNKWDIIVYTTKISGYRQAAFCNGNLIFTRILSNVQDPSLDVVNQNIEKEIINTIEYIGRLANYINFSIDLWIIVSPEQYASINIDSFSVNQVHLFTPHEVAQKLKFASPLLKPKDKYIDPFLLGFFHRNRRKLKPLYTPQIKKVQQITRAIQYARGIALAVLPVLLLSSIYMLKDLYNAQMQLNEISENTSELNVVFQEIKQEKTDLFSKYSTEITYQDFVKVMSISEELSSMFQDPKPLFTKMSQIMPNQIRTHSLYWSITAATSGKEREYALLFNIKCFNFGTTYEQLAVTYQNFVQEVTTVFNEYKVAVSSLPVSLNFLDFNRSIDLTVEIKGIRDAS